MSKILTGCLVALVLSSPAYANAITVLNLTFTINGSAGATGTPDFQSVNTSASTPVSATMTAAPDTFVSLLADGSVGPSDGYLRAEVVAIGSAPNVGKASAALEFEITEPGTIDLGVVFLGSSLSSPGGGIRLTDVSDQRTLLNLSLNNRFAGSFFFSLSPSTQYRLEAFAAESFDVARSRVDFTVTVPDQAHTSLLLALSIGALAMGRRALSS